MLTLFPAGSVAVKAHPVNCLTEQNWLAYLKGQGIDAEIYWYKDHPGKFENPVALDISPYLQHIPHLTAKPQDVDLPERFITVQWDSNETKRTIHVRKRKAIIKRYMADGYAPVVVGGEAQDDSLRWSLKHIAWAMSKAEFHVGVDSAFMHMAQLYMPYERIHLYNEPDGFYSHHALRALGNGAVLNCHHA